MYRKLSILTLILIMTFLVGCKMKDNKKIIDDSLKKSNTADEDDLLNQTDRIQQIVDSMTLDEKIGQLFIFGIDGTKIDENIINILENYKVGGFILFKDNINSLEQTLELVNSLKEKNSNNPLPLFFALDEEGGKVSRLSNIFGNLPSAKTIGTINDKNLSYEFGKVLAIRLKELGFNMNFAPVLDINSNPKNPVIGSRAFGSDVDEVVDNGIEVMKGINSMNIISVVKHFPGHGDVSVDSHLNLPVVNKPLEEIENFELVPFKNAIDSGVDGIMVAHILYPHLDSQFPATMSKNIITDVLRNKLSYDGVVISDDMTMGAIAKNYSVEEGALEFLKAGGDIVLICHGYENQVNTIEKLKQEIAEGNITESEIDKKVYRIIKLKEKYELSDTLIKEWDFDSVNEYTQYFLEKIPK